MSATLPARLGEPSRALIVARRTGRPRELLPTVIGTIVSQTLLNVLALVILGVVMFSTVDLFSQKHSALAFFAIAPLALVAVVLAAPALLRGGLPSRSRRVQAFMQRARAAMAQVRAGLLVFRRPRLGGQAVFFQLLAWAIQWLSCFVLLAALGLDDRAGIGAAAAVLFAVNVTAVLPATPSNLGVFQAACVAVLHGAYGVGSADALAYGIILQAVEIATAVVMGTPALLKEGLSWRDVRMRALHHGPVELEPLPGADARARAALAQQRQHPGEDERAGPQVVGVHPRAAQHLQPDALVDEDRDRAHHDEHRADVEDQPQRAGAQRAVRRHRHVHVVVLVDVRVGERGLQPEDDGRDHQPGAVGGAHQERPQPELARADAHRRPAEVRARLGEAEDPEGDQRDRGGQVQRRAVDHRLERQQRPDDDDQRQLVADGDRQQRADTARRLRSCIPRETANSQPIAGLTPW